MDNIIFKDNAEFEIKAGASESEIVAVMADFTVLGTLADALTVPGNLDQIKFKTNGDVTGEFDNMTMDAPLFKAVDVVGDMVQATFAIRPKTPTEVRLDAVESRQDVTDEAVQEVIISTMGGV